MTIKPSEMMKHICLPILCAACAFVSCVSRRVAEQTVVQRDSLEAVVRAKDSLIEVVFADINAVTENLARIRTRENLVALARNDEGVRRPIEEIDADSVAIDRLVQENRQKIDALENTLIFVNMALMPLLVILAGIVVAVVRHRRGARR